MEIVTPGWVATEEGIFRNTEAEKINRYLLDSRQRKLEALESAFNESIGQTDKAITLVEKTQKNSEKKDEVINTLEKKVETGKLFQALTVLGTILLLIG